MEAVVDVDGSSERAMGWCYNLDGKMLLGMAPEEECERKMSVWVSRAGERIAVPLAQLHPLSKDQETWEAVGDCLYWADRGYEAKSATNTCRSSCVAAAFLAVEARRLSLSAR